MMASYHTPVLLEEVAGLLITNKSGIYVDGTVGGGGHAEKILNSLYDDGRLVGLDVDADAVRHSSERLTEFGNRATVLRGNFADLPHLLLDLGIERVSGILLDLGVSSHQLDQNGRGFSHRWKGKLDMRMDQTAGVDAQRVVNWYSEGSLARIFFEYGEEKRATAIARAIARYREKKEITTTEELSKIISLTLGGPHLTKTLSRIFQAIRIEINRELENLKKLLNESVDLLEVGGRMVVISYHSLEDRIVKDFFRYESLACVCPPNVPWCVCGKRRRLTILTRKCIVPSSREISNNPRSRSAKLRAAERI
jgi:16S rRNA (cytosine1402-N4)-methyltransferase